MLCIPGRICLAFSYDSLGSSVRSPQEIRGVGKVCAFGAAAQNMCQNDFNQLRQLCTMRISTLQTRRW